ncbi:MAG TPA: DUF5317 domain-containing protein [Actinomycetota bacterium]
MYALLFVIVAGLLIGYARGGRIRNINSSRVRWLPVAWSAALLQIAAQFLPRSWSVAAFAFIVASYFVLFAFAGKNFRVTGMAFVALGAALNFAVILANQGMPVSQDAAVRAGIPADQTHQLVVRGKHFITTDDDVLLRPLSDIIPFRHPHVVSIGDLVIWAGLILLIQDLMVSRAHTRAPNAKVKADNPS